MANTKTTKMTKRTVINALVSYLESEDVNNVLVSDDEITITVQDGLNYLTHEIELLDKKASNKKATKTQEANESIKQVILDTLATQTEGVTISELQKLNDELGALSNQKVTALVRQMLNTKIKKTVEGKKSLFTLI